MTIHHDTAAGIDLGTNTFRLLIAERTGNNLKAMCKKLATVRLGRGLKTNGLLLPDAMQAGFEVLRTFRRSLDRYQPRSMRICGTEALRRARNSRIFLQEAEKILQQPVQLITGAEEARLSLRGALSGPKQLCKPPLLLVDVGGGSTELIFAQTLTADIRTTSVGLGVVRLTEKYITKPQHHTDRLENQITEVLETALQDLKISAANMPIAVIGSGGTATSMAALLLRLKIYDESLVHGHILSHTDMEKLWERLIVMNAEARNQLPGLGEGRGEILPAGIRIYYILLKLLGQNRMQVSDTGLLEGILLSSFSDCDRPGLSSFTFPG